MPGDQHQTPYADALIRHRDRVRQRFMIPGHSANQHGGSARLEQFLGAQALGLDIPQMIDGIDIGDRPAYDRARALAAEAWGARATWFLTNGASQGNRMALVAAASLGGKSRGAAERRVLVQRSSHSSVYDGLVMSGQHPVYAIPEIDPVHHVAHGVTVHEIERAFAGAARAGYRIGAVSIVSPSYFGVVADVPAIAAVCHAHGAALIVDASWGAHFGFHPALPESPTRQGADIVVSSIHKLGGSLTQTAMLHLADTALAAMLEPALEQAYLLTESTSLNSLLLASLDIARAELATGAARIEGALDAAWGLRRLIDEDPVLQSPESDFLRSGGAVAIDPLHVSIDVRDTGFTGMQLKRELAVGETATFVEIASPTTLVALVGALSAPEVEPFAGSLVDAIHQAARSLRSHEPGGAVAEVAASAVPAVPAVPAAPPAPGELVLTPREAYLAPHETVPASEAVGRVAAGMLAAYPPGIPNVVPGEVITEEAIEFLRAVAASPGGHVRGALDRRVDHVAVCAE